MNTHFPLPIRSLDFGKLQDCIVRYGSLSTNTTTTSAAASCTRHRAGLQCTGNHIKKGKRERHTPLPAAAAATLGFASTDPSLPSAA